MPPKLDFQIFPRLGVADLEALWRPLQARSDTDFFLSWDWIGTWLAELGSLPDVIAGRVDGQIVLLGALFPASRRTRIGFRVSSLNLHNVGNPAKDVITLEYNGFLVDRRWAGKVEAEAFGFLLGAPPRHACEIHLKNLNERYEAIPGPPGALRTVLWRKPSWRIDLAAIRQSGKSYIEQLSANTRQQIRRSMRLYEGTGPLTITRAPDVATAFRFLDGLEVLHQKYWIAKGAPGAFSYPFFVGFNRRLIETCYPRGLMELVRISRGDEPIGYLYNLIQDGQVRAYQSGFLYEEDARLKPGLVSHCLCIQRHLEEGAVLYDFMAGENRYKANLGKPGPSMSYVMLQRQTPVLQAERLLADAYRSLRRLMRPSK